MSCLHLIQTPANRLITHLPTLIGEQDALVLMNTAVDSYCSIISKLPKDIPLFILQQDIQAPTFALNRKSQQINYQQLLELCCQYSRNISW